MSPRLALLSLLLCACALRPRYEDLTGRFAPPGSGRTEVLLQVVDDHDAPVPGARIELGDRVRFKTVTDENGLFKLPVEKKYADENALVVVLLPKGVRGYRLVGPAPAPQVAAPPPAEAAFDAGVTTL